MAQVDIAGLLTGIPALQSPRMQGRINAANLPSGTPLPYLAGALEEGRTVNQAGMRRALGGLLGRDLRTEGEKAREAVGQATSNLELAQAIQGVAPEQAAALRRLAAQKQAVREQEKKRRQSLITQADSLGLSSTSSLLREGGNMEEAAKQIREIEQKNVLNKQGRRGKLALAQNKNVGQPVLDAINSGAYDSLTPQQFIETVLKGEKADLKAFTNKDGKPVMYRVNDAGKIYDITSDSWKNPTELNVAPAVTVNKTLTDETQGAFAAEASKRFFKDYNIAQDVPEQWTANAQAEEVLDTAFTGIGAEYKTSIAKVADLVGIPVFDNQEERITATEEFIINRARKTVQLLSTGALGAGTGLSDNDVKFAKEVIAGDITLTKETLKRFLAIERDALQKAAKRSNTSLDFVQKSVGENTIDLSAYRVVIPQQTVPTGVTVTRVQ